MIVKDIALIARDMWTCKVFGVSNSKRKEFRKPMDATPFGFEFYLEDMPLSIEVHPTVGASGRVIALNIYGIKKDGSATLLITEVV